MFNLDNLLKIAEVACESAIKAGAEFADVSLSQSKSISTDVEANKIKSCESQISGGISVRAIYKGGTGYSNSDDMSIEGAKKAGENSALLAKLAQPDPDFVSLVSPAESYPVINGLNDEKLLSLDIKDIIKFAEDNIKEAESAYAGTVVECSYSAYYTWSAFVNSLGVKLSSEKSKITGFCNAIVKDGDDVGAFYDYDISRNLDGFKHIGLGEKAVAEAKRYLGARKIPTQRMSLVLGPLASMSVLGEVPSAANAEAVSRKRSYLIGLEGKKVASEIVTIVDDPLIDYGINSRSADGEGTPTRCC
ncbi:MAG: TldD/PmbA family protein, partial [Armatimonadota bacterium]